MKSLDHFSVAKGIFTPIKNKNNEPKMCKFMYILGFFNYQIQIESIKKSQKRRYLRQTKFTLKCRKDSFKSVSKLISKSKSQMELAEMSFENPLTYKNVKMCVLPL